MASDLNPKEVASLARHEKNANDGRKHNHFEMSKRSGAEMAKRTEKLMAIFKELYQINDPEIRPPLQEQVKTLINHGVEVNAKSKKGDPLLVFAVRIALICIGRTTDEDEQMIRPYIKIICQLIDHGANPNMQDSTGRTPLLLAIEYQSIIHKYKGEQEDFMKLLIEKGAHVEQERMGFKGGREWPTPLIAASRKSMHSVVELLLARNVNVNAKVDGETALYTVARPGYDIYPMRVPKIFSMLLGHGGDSKRELRRILSRTICSCPGAVEPLLVHIFGEPEGHSHLNALRNIPQEITSNPTLEMEYRNFMANLYQLILMETGSTDSPRQIRKLCSSCQAFESHARFREWFFHSTNPEALSRSISHGCAMCSIIKDCLPESCKEIQLYYFSVRPQEDRVSRDYYERILVRCQKQGSLKGEGFVFGELCLAAIDENTTRMLNHATGLEDETTDSDSSFQMVAHWLQTCLTQHNKCQFSRDKHPLLPTRVVDVGPSDGSEDAKLFITKGHRGVYVCLSYCWGKIANIRTEISTMGSFQKRIPFDNIPKTIQEAIIVTRRLGIRYLWVDTLCIIQDSGEDWLREAKNISNVYRNCVLTIAASAADSLDSEGGLFRQRKRSRTRPVQFAPKIAPFQNSEIVFAFGDREGSRDALRCESRLDTQGWVLQEQLLSTRTLNYSSQELYWECPTISASESYPAGIPKDHDPSFERQRFAELKMNMMGNGQGVDKERMHLLWQDMVSLYSKRKLTVQTDRLVALAGAANQAAKIFDDTFIAGLWMKRLWRDLLWRVEGDIDSSNPLCVRQTEFTVPSWSWASIRGPITYEHSWRTNRMKFYPCIQILSYDQVMDTKVNDISDYIVVRGIVLPELYFPSKHKDLPDPIKPMSNPTSDLAYQAQFWKPDTCGVSHRDAQYLIVAACFGYAVCLGIEPTGRNNDEYRRVGLAYWWTDFKSTFPNEVEPQIVSLI